MARMTPAEMARVLGSGLLSFPVTHFRDDLGFDETAYRDNLGRAGRLQGLGPVRGPAAPASSSR